MRKFLLVDQVPSAAAYAAEREWAAVGYARYITPESDEIRVAARKTDLCPTPGGLLFIAGPGFEDGTHALEFKQMIKDGGTRWVKK
jgi:hypothetical protein